jgi:hypothetical protein
MEQYSNRIFWGATIASVLIKLTLAAAIPFTSDEAYFVLWGRYPGIGFYDHPPMIGWILQLLSSFGNSPILMRLPPVVFSTLVGMGIYLFLKKESLIKACLAGTLFMLSPINILNVLVTTDAPLFLFSFMSGILLYMALTTEKYVYYALSGLFLGGAFLSKYFAVLLGIAYFVYFSVSKKDMKRTMGFVILYLCLAPFVGLNLYYNYLNGWPNIMFNLINRNKNEVLSLGKVLVFMLFQLYLLLPPVIYYVYKKRKEAFTMLKASDYRFFVFVFGIPLLLFGILSFKKVIGLHWVLSFYPFYYLLVFVLLNEEDLRKSIKFMLIFSFLHLFLIGTILSLPLSFAKHNKHYISIIMGMRPQLMLNEFRKYENDFSFATPSYATAALLEYHYIKHVAVFGGGSSHARHDDILTDFNEYKGRNIIIVMDSKPQKLEYADYFESLEVKEVAVSGAAFYFVMGRGFKYENYRNKVLIPIKEKYYEIPKFLPYKNCSFLDKYFK